MSNLIMNQSGILAPTLAIKARPKVFRTFDGRHVDRVAGHSEQLLYTPYSTTLDLRVPPSDYPNYLRPADLTGFRSCPTHPSGGHKVSDLAFKPSWSGPAHFKFQATEGGTPLCRMPSA